MEGGMYLRALITAKMGTLRLGESLFAVWSDETTYLAMQCLTGYRLLARQMV